MPLTGEAKRAYHREYMRRVRRIAAEAGKTVHKALGRPISGAALVSQAAHQVSQEVLTGALNSAGWTVERHVGKRIELTEFKRRIVREDGDALEVPDGDVQCRAMDAMDRIMERVGAIPSVGTAAPPQTGRVRMIQVAPDGTRTLIEVEG